MKRIFSLLLFALPLFALADEGILNAQKHFAHQLAIQDHFNEKQVLLWLQKSKPDHTVIVKTDHPKEDASWDRYRRIFITTEAIEGGVAFYKKHQAILAQAYNQHGVDAATVVAIIGIESHYGKHQGSHNAVTALNTLAFYGKRRQRLFQRQLRDLFLLSRQLHVDPLTLKSSYAGAMGQPQFMPTTYLHYAASPHAKTPDLFTQPDDAIFSVANYLHKMGWKKNKAIALKLKKATSQSLQFQENGKIVQWGKAENFRAIHRYNQSNKYVLIVASLANEIRQKL